MTAKILRNRGRVRVFALSLGAILFAVVICVFTAAAEDDGAYFHPGNLVLSRSVYDNAPNNIKVGTTLPPNCVSGCSAAVVDGTYPYVWNNDGVDASFGITSKIFLDQITRSGALINSLEVPNSSPKGMSSTKDQVVTSFPSKSELALNLSTDGQYLTFMGYVAPIDALDVSNSNTPAVFDASNPVGLSDFRAVAQIDQHGRFHVTKTNAYSGNNGRAAILNNSRGANLFYMAGNAGNGGNPQPDGIIIGAGAQVLKPDVKEEEGVAQTPGIPTPVASFNITQLVDPKSATGQHFAVDKVGKDTNFRGLTIFNNVLYYTKGSGGNGVNTVYFVDTTGTVCTDANGVGLPVAGAPLPASGLAFNPAVLQTKGLDPNNMCILNGFPTALKSKTAFPFGIWFANATTLYVADEGNGTTGTTVATFYDPAKAQTTAGLQKWIFDSGTGKWKLAYVLKASLNLGVPYSVNGYPAGNNSGTAGTGFPWAPAPDGLRNITGVVNGDNTATIYAVTSTISGSGDQGADPNQLVAITDNLGATTLPGTESFVVLKTAAYGEVLRGVSFTPRARVGE
jgi:hypothetical protein